MGKTKIKITPVAGSVPFDNTGVEDCYPTATNVDEALREICYKVDHLGPFTDTMYWANSVCHCDGLMFSDFEPLVDYTYNAIKVEDC
jgi:hypothetical protein